MDLTRGWLASTCPREMLAQLGDRAGPRKLRLFAVACCRPLVARSEGRAVLNRVLGVCEQHAEGRASDTWLLAARDAMRDQQALVRVSAPGNPTESAAAQAVALALEAPETSSLWRLSELVAWGLTGERGTEEAPSHAYRSEQVRQANLLREVLGNPFRPALIDPVWLSASDGAALRLARGIEEGQRFDELPVLADALEEAGCADEPILSHCRHGKEHARGCWVVDALLGR